MKTLMQELVDMVIDNIQDSPADLRASSLVCRSWAHRSRRYLFGTTCLASEEDMCKWAAAFTPSPTMAKTHLVDPCQLVTTLRIGADSHLDTSSLTLFTSHLQNFKNVKSLSLINWHPSALMSQSPKFHFGHFVSLRSLTLINTTCTGAAPLLRFICTFPHLDDLDIRCLSIKKETARNSKSLKRKYFAHTIPSFSGHLSLSSYGYNPYCAGFLNALVSLPVNFSSMSLQWIGVSQFQDWTTLFESSASTLKHLELSVSEDEDTEDYMTPLSINANKVLESITINLEHNTETPTSIAWIADFFKTVSSPALSHIVFVCYDLDPTQNEDDQLHWLAIDRELIRLYEESKMGLHIVVRVLPGGLEGLSRRKVRRIVKAWLPRVHKSDTAILMIDYLGEGEYMRCQKCGARYEGAGCDCGDQEETDEKDEDEEDEEEDYEDEEDEDEVEEGLDTGNQGATGQALVTLNDAHFEETMSLEEAKQVLRSIWNDCIDSFLNF